MSALNPEAWSAVEQELVLPKVHKTLRVQTLRGVLWYHACKQKPVTVVLIHDPAGEWRDEVLLSTRVAATAAEMIVEYGKRWSVKTFFKLLKSAGQQLEYWQQEDGAAVLKRLLIASMASVLAWRLGHSQAPQADAARRVVMSLSGRQVEDGKKFTLEGLLAGTWVLLAMAALLKETSAAEVQQLANFVRNGSVPTSTQPGTRRDTG